MNKQNTSSIFLVSQILLTTRYQHCSMSNSTKNREFDEEDCRVRCPEDLPIWFLHCFMRLSAHATAVVVVVVADATAARSSPLHHHHHRCLRSCHTAVCWSGPRPLPSTGRRTGRWSPRTLTPPHGVIGVGRVPSTGLHH
jgi:hypothetical protein